MNKKTYPVSESVTILVRGHADLALQGWDKMEVYPLTESRHAATVQAEGEILRVTLTDDGEVFIPMGATVQVERVGGDAFIRNITGKLAVERVGGDLAVQDVADAAISNIGGDCIAVGVSGALAIHRIGGDLVANGIMGSAAIGNVGGDADIELVAGNLDLKAGGDVCLTLVQTAEQLVSVRAGGDINLYLSNDPSVEVTILSRSEDIRVRVQGGKQRFEQRTHQVKMGDGAAKTNLQAGGDVIVTDESIETECFTTARENIEEHWQDLEESRAEREADADEEGFMHGEDISRRVNRHVEEAMRRADERIATAMKRVEERTRQIGRDGMVPPMPPLPTMGRPRKSIFTSDAPPSSTTPGGLPPVPTPAPARPIKTVVSEEERMLILTMLQEKKISAEEAARLLEALERS